MTGLKETPISEHDLRLPAEFAQMCQRLGHDSAKSATSAGDERLCLIPDLPTYRSFVTASPAQKRQRARHFFNPGVALRARLGQGLHDRGEASVFAVHTLNEADKAALDIHLPLHMKTLSLAHKRVEAGETWDVSLRGDPWGLDEMEELYVTLNIGRLELAPGARLIVRGNVFVMLCQQLVVEEPRADWQIGILPTPHSVDYGSGPMRGRDGAAGAAGVRGRDGREIDTEEGFLGPRAREALRPELLCGAKGGDGGAGENGKRGRNGGACKLADITLRSLTGHLGLFAQAGRGGDGGDGGAGGDGAAGGAAAVGPALPGQRLPDGTPGDGGKGGTGGDGGAAGGGGIASNIYLTVPEEALARIKAVALPSEPGLPGKGGAGGIGGAAGATTASGPSARAGEAGTAGRPGAPGRPRLAPWIFLNDTPPQDG